jgi:hypothetical protein
LPPTSPKSLNKWALAISTVPYARNMVGGTNCIILVTAVSIILTVLLPKGMEAQEMHKGTDMLTRTVQT